MLFNNSKRCDEVRVTYEVVVVDGANITSLYLQVSSKVNVKVWTLVIAPLTRVKTHDQQRFKISEVAADWHEPMVPQRIMWPSTARANGQLDPRCS